MNSLAAGSLLTLVEGVGDFALKKYAMGGVWGYLPLGVTVYTGLAFLLTWLFKTSGFAMLNATWDATSNVFTMIVGYLVFKEVYSAKEWFGMLLVTLGLVFINGSNAK